MKLTIGQLARRAGVSIQALIHYEGKGILPPPARNHVNHRLYSPDAIGQVRFIKGAQSLGFTLAEIRGLLAVSQTPNLACRNVRTKLQEKIAALDEKMSVLAAMRRDLTKLAELCPEEAPVAECPVVESLRSNGSGRHVTKDCC